MMCVGAIKQLLLRIVSSADKTSKATSFVDRVNVKLPKQEINNSNPQVNGLKKCPKVA